MGFWEVATRVYWAQRSSRFDLELVSLESESFLLVSCYGELHSWCQRIIGPWKKRFFVDLTSKIPKLIIPFNVGCEVTHQLGGQRAPPNCKLFLERIWLVLRANEEECREFSCTEKNCFHKYRSRGLMGPTLLLIMSIVDQKLTNNEAQGFWNVACVSSGSWNSVGFL